MVVLLRMIVFRLVAADDLPPAWRVSKSMRLGEGDMVSVWETSYPCDWQRPGSCCLLVDRAGTVLEETLLDD